MTNISKVSEGHDPFSIFEMDLSCCRRNSHFGCIVSNFLESLYLRVG